MFIAKPDKQILSPFSRIVFHLVRPIHSEEQLLYEH